MYAGRAARSATKSKICSRGAEITVETVTWRTAPASLLSGRAAHDGEPPLAHADALERRREARLVRQPAEAELAERASAVELVQPLAGQRRAVALLAAVGSRRQGADAAAHEHR